MGPWLPGSWRTRKNGTKPLVCGEPPPPSPLAGGAPHVTSAHTDASHGRAYAYRVPVGAAHSFPPLPAGASIPPRPVGCRVSPQEHPGALKSDSQAPSGLRALSSGYDSQYAIRY